MKVIPFLFLCTWLILINVTCTKPISDSYPSLPCMYDCDTSKLELVWIEPLNLDTTTEASFVPLLWNNHAIYSSTFKNPDGDIIHLHDGITGERKWEWANYVRPADHSYDVNSHYVYQDRLIISCRNQTYAIDLYSGTTLWNNDVINGIGDPRANLINDYIYQGHTCYGDTNLSAYLTRLHVNGGEWDTVYVFKSQDGYSNNFEPPALWINPYGDSVLFFQNRSWNFSKSDGKIDLIAYNLNKNKEEFFLGDVDLEGNSSTAIPLIHLDKAYFLGTSTVYCIDLKSGKLAWKHAFIPYQVHFMGGSMLMFENKLIVKAGTDELYALDSKTGNIIWNLRDIASGEGHMSEYNGYLYFLGGYFCMVNARTGQQLIKQRRSPSQFLPIARGEFGAGSGLIVDGKNGYIYLSDSRYAMCIKIPK